MDAQTAWTGFDAGRLARIGDHLERAYVAPGKIAGCQVAVWRHGHLAYQAQLGQMDRERGVAMREDTLFRIYSMTKPIVSVALMTLFERGLFELDDPITRFFPEWSGQRVWASGEGETMVTEPARRPVTIRDMLTHRGGLTYGGGLPGVGIEHAVDHNYRALKIRSFGGTDDLMSFMSKLAQVPLRFQPGTAWMYSLSSDVCGALVERISGQPLDQYLQSEIFDPLGMVDTAFHVPAEKVHRFAANYQRNVDKTTSLFDDPAKSAYLQPPRFLSGGGGLVGTTADYVRFCEMLRRGGALDGVRVLGPRTVALMHANHLPGGADLQSQAIGLFSETENAGVGFGLGFAMTIDRTMSGTIATADYYWGGAASTLFWVDPVEQLSVVFMTQLMPSRAFNFRGQLRTLIYAAITD